MYLKQIVLLEFSNFGLDKNIVIFVNYCCLNCEQMMSLFQFSF